VSASHREKEAAVENGSDSAATLREVLALYEREYTGEGEKLRDALDAAYEKGKESGHQVFRVQEIFIRGDNPLSGYGVVITPHG
jgi:hypothetical protein